MIKPWTSLDEQVNILVQRGLTDAPEYRDFIKRTGYYRFSGFAYPFRIRADAGKGQPERSEIFLPGTSMDNVVKLYRFDEKLRLVVWLAVRELEIAVRSSVGNELGRVDPLIHDHLEQICSTGKLARRTAEFNKKLNVALDRSNEDFVIHHRANYDGQMPVWALTEVLDFGGLVTLFSLAPFEQRSAISDQFGCRADEFESWLRTMNLLRNICAHHARLWNKVITVRPIVKYKQDTMLFSSTLSNPGKPFAALTILSYLLAQIVGQSQLYGLQGVLTEFPDHIPGITPQMMGMPENWYEAPVWQC